MNFKDQSTYKLLSILSKLARNSSEASRKNFANKLAAFIYNFFPFRKTEAFNNIKIAFDVADPFVVERNKDEFLDMIKNDVDIVFANQAELSILFNSNDTKASINELINYINCGGIKLGKKGSMVFNNKTKYEIKPSVVKSKDSTGAGDMYAAGFLSSLSKLNNFQLAGELGVALAEEIIQIEGAQFDKKTIDGLKSKLF